MLYYYKKLKNRWAFSQTCGNVGVTKERDITKDTASIEKHVSESEREDAHRGHEGSRKVPWKEHEHRGARGLDREAHYSAYH